MTEEVKDQQSNEELESLKQRAKQMGIKFHHKTGLDKMRALVNDALRPPEPSVAEPEAPAAPEVSKARPVPVTAMEKALRAMKSVPLSEQPPLSPKKKFGKLVRIRINCMNPNKAEWEGEIFTVGNAEVSFKKYVPFNNDEGWYVPEMILKYIQEKECQVFHTQKDDKGNKTRVGRLQKEFAVEILPDLTNEEMDALAQRQAMAGGLH